MDRLGQLGIQALPALAIALVVAGIAIAIGTQVSSETSDSLVDETVGCNSTYTTGCGVAYNATESTVSGLGSLADKMPLIGLVVGAVVVLGLVIGGLAFRRR